MAVIRPFQGVRPAKELASSIAALPYDVYDREEAREVVDKNPLSFFKNLTEPRHSLHRIRICIPSLYMTGPGTLWRR